MQIFLYQSSLYTTVNLLRSNMPEEVSRDICPLTARLTSSAISLNIKVRDSFNPYSPAE